jgi:hypothetical protein
VKTDSGVPQETNFYGSGSFVVRKSVKQKPLFPKVDLPKEFSITLASL